MFVIGIYSNAEISWKKALFGVELSVVRILVIFLSEFLHGYMMGM